VSAAVISNVSEAMRGVVGAEISRRVSFPVAASDIRKWAIAVYHPHQPPPRYWDEDVIAALPGGRLLAPQEFNPFAWMTARPKGFPVVDRLDPDILEKTLGVPGPGLTHQLNGGVDVEYLADFGVGDVVTAVRHLDGYREREGRLGLMLFTTVREAWTDQHGTLLQIRRQTGIRY
jgi:hypothetical protein